jgi:hypothetical protein
MPQRENPHAGQGPVLLDIGGDIGALVVRMPEALTGQEIEIRPVGRPAKAERAPLQHVAVLPRPGRDGTVPSAVFAQLPTGRYELYQRPAGPVRLTVDVSGGGVTHATWPDDA